MNKATSTPKELQQSDKKKNIVLSTLAFLIVALLLGVAVPLAMSDGTEKYNGAEKRAAVAQLNSVKGLTNMTEKAFSGIISYHVERVFKTPDDQVRFWCGGSSTGQDVYYSVTVSERTFFGLKLSEVTRHDTCILL